MVNCKYCNDNYRSVFSMVKLKTLKDLEGINQLYDEDSDDTFIARRDLKAEAVKWVEYLDKRISQGIAYDFTKMKIIWKAQIDILTKFHNITEEDLVK